MNRDDVLVWLSLAWFVALCGAAIWVLFWPADQHFRVDGLALLAMLLNARAFGSIAGKLVGPKLTSVTSPD